MATNDSFAALVFSNSPLAYVHASVDLVEGFGQAAVESGICHSLPLVLAQQSTAGVRFHNSLLPGEVVR